MEFGSDLTSWLLLSIPTLALLWVIHGVIRALRLVWWTPLYFRRTMEKQGVRGPPGHFIVGNLAPIFQTKPDPLTFTHDHVGRLMDYHVNWSRIYGKRHLFWLAFEPNLVIADMDLLKQVYSSKNALLYGKAASSQKILEPLVGNGLATANGLGWSHHRKVVAPAFRYDELKMLTREMIAATEAFVNVWESRIREWGGKMEIEAGKEFKSLTADIIARTEFGSNYQKGIQLFEDMDHLKDLIFRFDLLSIIPGASYLPAPSNLKKRKLRRQIESGLEELVMERRNRVKQNPNESYGADLLGLLLAEAEKVEDADGKKTRPLTTKEVMDECKTFFFGGHETTATLLTWTFLMIAAYPEWQERARAEAIRVCKGGRPDADSLSELKDMGMLLYETLRLYPVGSMLSREVQTDTQLGDLFIPKGMSVWIPVLAIHQDKELWGEDATEFKPERFAEGIGKACKHPMAFQGFALGPRNCIGQNFALMEAKIVMAYLLLHFKFTLSPAYKHSPQTVLTIIQPKYGVPLIVEKV